MWIMAAVGAILASLYVVVSALLTVSKAKATGVWVGKSAGKRVSRAEEPERFQKLCRDRVATIWLPLGVSVLAALFIASQVWAIIQMNQQVYHR